MECRRVTLREGISLALDRLDVQHHRAIESRRLVEEVDQRRDVVPVDRADGDEVEFLEPGIFRDQRFTHLAHAVIEIREGLAAGDVLGDFLGRLFEATVGVAQSNTIEVGGHGALWLRDRHAVVVEDHEELSA